MLLNTIVSKHNSAARKAASFVKKVTERPDDEVVLGLNLRSAGAFPEFTSSGTVALYTRTFELTESFWPVLPYHRF